MSTGTMSQHLIVHSNLQQYLIYSKDERVYESMGSR